MDSPADARRHGDNPGQEEGSPGGRRSNVALLIDVVRDPVRLRSLKDGQRRAVMKLRERFDPPLLALIVFLENLILTAHGSREAFVVHIRRDGSARAGQLTKQTLHDHLGGRRNKGPDWWLASLIATYCVPAGEDPQRVMDSVCQLWLAAHGAPPPGHVTASPATPQLIRQLIDPPFDPINAGAETAHLRRRAEEAEQCLAIARAQAGEEEARRLVAEAQAEAARHANERLRDRLAEAERDRHARRDHSDHAAIQAAQYREQLARAQAQLELAGIGAVAGTPGASMATGAGLANKLATMKLLLSVTAPASHRALAAYVGTHAVLTGNLGPEQTAPGIHPDIAKRFLRAEYLPGQGMVLTLAQTAGADASYTRHLYSAAARDSDNTVVDGEFSQIVAKIGEDEHRPAAAKAHKERRRTELLGFIGGVACALIGFAAIVGALAAFVGLFAADTTYFAYRSGDKPRTLTVLETYCAATTAVASCNSWTQPNGYQWRVGARSRQRTSFRADDASFPALGPSRHAHLAGILQYSARGCPGSQIAWTINIPGSSPISGTLNGRHSRVQLYKLIPNNPAITVQIARTDDLSCASQFTWNNAQQLRPAPVRL